MRRGLFGSSWWVPLVMVLSLPACGRSATASEDMLIPEFAIRSDTPYMRGPIVQRIEGPGGELRIRVKAGPGVFARAPEAIATVLPNAMLRWSDGDHATRDQLRVGRVVTVWVTGAELRSMPPQVAANGLILERPRWR